MDPRNIDKGHYGDFGKKGVKKGKKKNWAPLFKGPKPKKNKHPQKKTRFRRDPLKPARKIWKTRKGGAHKTSGEKNTPGGEKILFPPGGYKTGGGFYSGVKPRVGG